MKRYVSVLLLAMVAFCILLSGCASAQENQAAVDAVIANFMELTKIPRQSHHEENISAYLYDWAIAQGYGAQQDESLNLIIDVPASKGLENVPLTILQAHMDMVCVAAEGVAYDPLTDPIDAVNDGVSLTANGTSLGADDGIGVAIIMYLLQDDTLSHGPLRILFTTNEEDGMTGAYALDAAHLANAAYLINIDWETGTSMCTSCAGSYHYLMSRQTQWEQASGTALILSVSGLQGGHSGVEINKGRANAIKVLAGILFKAELEGLGVRIAQLEGGTANNAIPANAKAILVVESESEAARLQEIMQASLTEFDNAYGLVEGEREFTLESADLPQTVLTQALSSDLIHLLTALPFGVHTMSQQAENLVECSQNVGPVKINKNTIDVTIYARSSVDGIAKALIAENESICNLAGFSMEEDGPAAPGWPASADSRIQRIVGEAYKTVTGREMIAEPVHAGLECGWFAEKNPALDMVAIGPTLHDVHSPDETLDLNSIPDLLATARLALQMIASE